MKDNGKMIFKMEWEQKYGMMELHILVNIKMV
jgi:hypothetical protein